MKKIKLDVSSCIRCGVCYNIDEVHFDSNEEGFSVIINEEVTSDNEENAIEAMESCPTNAISIE